MDRLISNIPELLKTDRAVIVMGIVLLFAASQISIPLQPVPITLQTVGVMWIAMMYSPRNAFFAVSNFLLLGAIGLPIFANFTGGPAILMGPTGGYLIGFLPAAVAISYIIQTYEMKSYFMQLSVAILLNAIVFLVGVTWLSIYLGSFSKGIQFGFLPFIIPGLVKAALLVGVVHYVKKK